MRGFFVWELGSLVRYLRRFFAERFFDVFRFFAAFFFFFIKVLSFLGSTFTPHYYFLNGVRVYVPSLRYSEKSVRQRKNFPGTASIQDYSALRELRNYFASENVNNFAWTKFMRCVGDPKYLPENNF
mgnify:CR=1 FL=1